MGKKSKEDSQAPADDAGMTAASAVMDAAIGDWLKVRSGLHLIPIDMVMESEDNARKTFPEAGLRELAASILADGGVNLVAAIVRPLAHEDATTIDDGDPLFELISGARRLRALKMNGATHIKCEIIDVADDGEAHRRSLIANMDREDINPVELAEALQKQMDDGRYKSVAALAKALGKEDQERSIQDLLHLQRCIPEVKKALVEWRIEKAHAVLISREIPADQARALEACFRPEARDNGAGTEMVNVLISERQLRQWIQDVLRKPTVEQSQMFDTRTDEEKADQAQTEQLDAGADAELSKAGVDPRTGLAGAQADPANSVKAGSSAGPDESDISDDDLTPDQAAAVKPEEGTEYTKEQEARFERCRSIVSRIKYPWPLAMYKHLALKLATHLSINQLTDVCRMMHWDKIRPALASTADIMGFIGSFDMGKIDDAQQCAKVVTAMSLMGDLNPNVEPKLLPALEETFVRVDEGDRKIEEIAQRRKDGSSAAAEKKQQPKEAKPPSPKEVAKVMKAEKAKLEKKAAKPSVKATKAKKKAKR